MKGYRTFFQNICFVAISSIGGFLLSLTGLSIGWLIGTMVFATLLSILQPRFLEVPIGSKGIQKHWLYTGQFIIGIELSQKMNTSILFILKDNWLIILTLLLISTALSLLFGLILWKFTNLDLLTSFFSTAPGGLSTIPGIAEEVGANTGIVSIIQSIRAFLVILFIPVFLSTFFFHTNSNHVTSSSLSFNTNQLTWTALFILVAVTGYYIVRYLKFPAPWLIGSMTFIALFKSIVSLYFGIDIIAWWPHWFIVISQIFIGASIGSKWKKSMFIGLKRILIVSSICTILFISSMFLCAYLVYVFSDLSFITSALAFTPGGITEMATTALVLQADATFVVTMQVLRVISVCMLLPPVFRMLNQWELKKKTQSRISVQK
ncbi:AbrB family transcriptional regulator [Calidifontibacillus erzurumensis]|uniref:AbrB family transcriptional regulator n=1 Tax=Calidifontibacillus erzurumensis TaxID=2741433 RepID=UPI0035B523CC